MEDDEDKPGVKSFKTTVGGYSNIKALNEAIIGMKVGGVRRFSILPQKGWEKPTKACDGGPGGGGTGGEIKTDYVVRCKLSCFEMWLMILYMIGTYKLLVACFRWCRRQLWLTKKLALTIASNHFLHHMLSKGEWHNDLTKV